MAQATTIVAHPSPTIIASVTDLPSRLADITGVEVVIYEPTLRSDEFAGCPVIHDLKAFKQTCDVIVTNRYHKDLDDVADKLYTRDLYQRD